MTALLRILFAAFVLIAISLPALAQEPPKRAIIQIQGDLWRFQNNFHYSVFLVTKDGVITTDPINGDAARWLKAKIKAQFNVPVRYVILSHDHADHSSGAEVFADDGAVVVAHQRAKQIIVGEKRPTAVPDITFNNRMNISLGGQQVRLRYLGKNHSDNMIVMHFTKKRALFAVDFIPVKTVAFRDFPDAYIPEWIQSLRKVERMDFDILVPGHGRVGEKADVTAFREYMEDLHGQVLQQIRLGKSLETIHSVIDLTKYSNWGQFKNWSPLNIEGMYQRIQLNRRGNQ
jgi:glyoxylase-like metal-dependent hydrolase (beta-lactamase superfamily II)